MQISPSRQLYLRKFKVSPGTSDPVAESSLSFNLMFRKVSLQAKVEKRLEHSRWGSVRDHYEGQCIERVRNTRIIRTRFDSVDKVVWNSSNR
jgi:hypothetical protein